MDLDKLYKAKIFCSVALTVQIVIIGLFIIFSLVTINTQSVKPDEVVIIKTPVVLDYLFWITVFLDVFIWALIKIQERKERQINDNLPIDRI